MLNEWQASLLLQSLKEQHHRLRQRTWDQVAANADEVAKLYSGYMGAGGQWEQWRQSPTPGAVARQRLGYRPDSGTYEYVRAPADPSSA